MSTTHENTCIEGRSTNLSGQDDVGGLHKYRLLNERVFIPRETSHICLCLMHYFGWSSASVNRIETSWLCANVNLQSHDDGRRLAL